MANPWCRLYSEFADDPKVQMMTEAMQRRLVMLFCLRCKEEKFHEQFVAFHWRISPEELAATKALFLAHGFIDEDWNLLNWNKRQFISDSSTERTRDYREKKKQQRRGMERSETSQDRYGNDGHTGSETNGSVTAPSQERHSDGDETKRNVTVTDNEGVFELPLPGNQGEWSVPQKLFDQLVAAYPDLSIMGELAKARVWLVANAANRKTPSGMPKFIANWMSRAQNDATRNAPRTTTGGNTYARPRRGTEDVSAGIRALMDKIADPPAVDPAVPGTTGGDAWEWPADEQSDDGIPREPEPANEGATDPSLFPRRDGVQVFPRPDLAARFQWPTR